MFGLTLRKALIVAAGFWLVFWLVLRVNDEALWLDNVVVYYALFTFMLTLPVGALVHRFGQTRSGPLKS